VVCIVNFPGSDKLGQSLPWRFIYSTGSDSYNCRKDPLDVLRILIVRLACCCRHWHSLVRWRGQ